MTCIFYDVFKNFLKVYITVYTSTREIKTEMKNSNYFKYIIYSRFYPTWKALKQWRVSYPIVLFVIPPTFTFILGQSQISSLNLFIVSNIYFFVLPLALFAYLQIKIK